MESFQSLKNQRDGELCVVLGNGPSLTIDFITRIHHARVFSIAVNGFCVIFDETPFRPDAVCMSNYDAINRYGNCYPDETLKFFRAGWGQGDKGMIPNVYELPFLCQHEIGKHGGSFICEGNFTLDPEKENFCGDTVILDFAIPVAVHMGFKDILLVGVDCDYSKGYFSGKYQSHVPEDLKGMINGDYSIAIPSYRYTLDFLRGRGRRIRKINPSQKLDFIETCTLEDALRVRTG